MACWDIIGGSALSRDAWLNPAYAAARARHYAMAEAHYLQVAPHVYGGPLIAAAALHLSVCSPNLLIMEAVERFDGVHAQFVESSFEWHGGYLTPPRGPGLGFNLREDVARSHAPRGPQPGTIRPY